MRGSGQRYLLLAGVIALLATVLALGGCAKPAATPEAKAPEASSTPAASDPSLADIQSKGVLIIGTAPFYAPFESTNEKTKAIEGFDVDMMNAIATKMGVKAEFKPADWQALLGGLEKGDYDVIVSAMSKKEAAGNNVDFSEVYYLLPDVIIVKKGNPKGITGEADLSGKIVGVQLGSGSEQLADELKGKLGFKSLKKYKLTQDAMNDLKVGRIDAVIAGQAFAVEQSKVDPSFELVGEPLTTAEIVGVFPKGNASAIEAFNKALADIKADGTYDALIAKWLTVKQ
ncbi:MAG: amino acid ABC transporter substrate-binding protein [Coriobacteriia bacterium]|nr:amino acid ABC transporter substrate-binding protein [Coriobacteriia bacterium]